MRRTIVVLGIIAFIGPAAVVTACGDDKNGDGRIDLPPRADGGTDGPTDGGGSPQESCGNLALKVGEPAACDKCAKEKCCAQVLACTKSEECDALQECLAPCDQSDIICIGVCQEQHSGGATLLRSVGTCAKSKCKAECPDNTPDADIFGDGGL